MKSVSIKEAALDLGWRKAAEQYSVDFESIKVLIQFLVDNGMKNQGFTVAKEFLSPALFKELLINEEFKNCSIVSASQTLGKYGITSQAKPSKPGKNRQKNRKESRSSQESSRTQKKKRTNIFQNNGEAQGKSGSKGNGGPNTSQPKAGKKKRRITETQQIIEKLGLRYSKDIFFIQNSEKNFEYMLDHFQGAKVISFSIKTYKNKFSFLLLASYDTVAVFDCNNLRNNSEFKEFLISLFEDREITKITLQFKEVYLLAEYIQIDHPKFAGIIEVCRIQIAGNRINAQEVGDQIGVLQLKYICKEFMKLSEDLADQFPKEINPNDPYWMDLDLATLEVYLFLQIFIHFDNNQNLLHKEILFSEDIIEMNKNKQNQNNYNNHASQKPRKNSKNNCTNNQNRRTNNNSSNYQQNRHSERTDRTPFEQTKKTNNSKGGAEEYYVKVSGGKQREGGEDNRRNESSNRNDEHEEEIDSWDGRNQRQDRSNSIFLSFRLCSKIQKKN